MGLAALAAGAGVGLAFFGASFLITPKERIVYTPGPERVVTKEVPGPERVITKEVPGPERVITPPKPPVTDQQSYPPANLPPVTKIPPSDMPKTPEEQKFFEQPEYQSSIYHGRIVKSTDGQSISFADGKSFRPAHWDGIKVVTDEDFAFDTDDLIGDLAMCVEGDHGLWDCTAMHQGHSLVVGWKKRTKDIPL
jgi:hypothetical protein